MIQSGCGAHAYLLGALLLKRLNPVLEFHVFHLLLAVVRVPRDLVVFHLLIAAEPLFSGLDLKIHQGICVKIQVLLHRLLKPPQVFELAVQDLVTVGAWHQAIPEPIVERLIVLLLLLKAANHVL